MRLFIYDHCPYCVKARMIFGLKNINIQLVTLLNDDEKTPISMIGKKMVPILEKAPGQFMPESMDIIQFIDQQFPPTIIHKEEDPFLLETLNQARIPYYSLVMPRWVSSTMEEFNTASARKYFQNKKEQMIGPFSTALTNTETYIKEITETLLKIEKKIKNQNKWYMENQVSFNDFHLFAFLRALTIVKTLPFPPRLEDYIKQIAKKSQIPLSTNIAL